MKNSVTRVEKNGTVHDDTDQGGRRRRIASKFMFRGMARVVVQAFQPARPDLREWLHFSPSVADQG